MEDKIISVIKRGPATSKDIAKFIQKDTTIAGAYLSDLSSRKKVLVTHLSNGSSPFYYLPENRMQLMVLSKYLDPKDLETYNLIFEKKILREKELQLLPRLSLRNMKDFAIQLNIVVEGVKEIFWKWYLVSDEEAEKMIGDVLDSQESKRKELVEQKLAEQKAEELRILSEARKAEDLRKKEDERRIEEERRIGEERVRKLEELRKEEQKKADEIRLQEQKINEEKLRDEVKKKEIESLEKMNKMIQEKFADMQRQFDLKYKELDKHKKDLEESFRKKEEEYLRKFDELKSSVNVVVEEPDEFLEMMNKYCNDNKLEIVDTTVVKKKKEIDMIVVYNGAKYFLKAKNKKKCNETDLIGAYVAGNERGMSVMFVSGEMTKKASEMLNNELNNKVFYRKLD